MILISIVLVILTTMGAVFAPWFAPLLIASVFHLMELWVPSFLIIIVCTITATITTTWIRFLNWRIHQYLQRFSKNKPDKKWRSWKLRRWFDKKFSIITNQKVLFIAIMIWSWSMIPDIFLVEFGRIKMKFQHFIIAVMLGKLWTYCLMVYGFESFSNIIDKFL